MKHILTILSGIALAALVSGCRDDASAETENAAPPKMVEHHAPKPKICADCGTIEAIDKMRKAGDSSGAGAVLGAVLGGVLGHQVGKGRGKDVATAAGAVAGGYGGYEAEKGIRSSVYYSVKVHMEDGSARTVNVSDATGLAVGGKMRVVGNDLEPREG